VLYIIKKLLLSFIKGVPSSYYYNPCLPAGYRNNGTCWGGVRCHTATPLSSSYLMTSVIPLWWWWCPALRVTNYNYKHPWEWLLSRIVPHPSTHIQTNTALSHVYTKYNIIIFIIVYHSISSIYNIFIVRVYYNIVCIRARTPISAYIIYKHGFEY